MRTVLEIIKDPQLTYRQRFSELAKAAENSIDPIVLSEEARHFYDEGVVGDMDEGKAPYRPRYNVVDFDLFLQQGSEFLELEPPKDIWDAVSNLMVLYHHIPSNDGQLVYIGHLDRLLTPFHRDKAETRKALKMLLIHIDRTLANSFVHADLGPEETEVGHILLELTAEMQRPVPNMSILYNEDKTPDAFALKAVETALVASKPCFANDKISSADWGEYAVASCYNILPFGGGNFTLGRLNFARLATLFPEKDRFFENFPRAVHAQCEQMDKRAQYIVDECNYFENSFLVKEELLHRDRYITMFGMVGLAHCVNTLLGATEQKDRYGHSEEANALGKQLLDWLEELVTAYKPKYGKFYLHEQVGLAGDHGLAPGTRIPVGEEPDLHDHLAFTAKMQQHFPTGTGEVFSFDETAKRNPQAMLDITKGLFGMGARYFSFYSGDSELVRVTGYLAKRSDIEKFEKGEQTFEISGRFGLANKTNGANTMGRKVRSIGD